MLPILFDSMAVWFGVLYVVRITLKCQYLFFFFQFIYSCQFGSYCVRNFVLIISFLALIFWNVKSKQTLLLGFIRFGVCKNFALKLDHKSVALRKYTNSAHSLFVDFLVNFAIENNFIWDIVTQIFYVCSDQVSFFWNLIDNFDFIIKCFVSSTYGCIF